MESTKDESEVPFETNDEICQKLVEQFVSCTDTDEALAQFYLQDRNWNLHNSVNDYFDDLSKQQKQKRKSEVFQTKDTNHKSDGSDDSDSDIEVISPSNHNLSKISKTESNSDKSTSIESNANSSTGSTSDNLKEIRFVTWNIDGIDEKNIRIRTEAVSNLINEGNVNIVFLQEVIPSSEKILREKLPKYEFFSGNSNVVDYYTLTLIHKDSVKLVSNEIVEFEESSMGRNLLKTRVKVGNNCITLLNSHLESTKEFAETRMAQLKLAFKLVSSIPQTDTVIFGGDLNLRDSEVTKIGGLPLKVVDVWIETGSRKEVQYTWDLMRNDNLQFDGKSRFKPRFRFDRVYIRESTPAKIDAIHFGLIGLQRLKPHVCFPSDHWGVRCLFRLL